MNERSVTAMVLDRALIKKSEESAVESGAFSFRELMYRAGCAAADTVTKKYASDKLSKANFDAMK